MKNFSIEPMRKLDRMNWCCDASPASMIQLHTSVSSFDGADRAHMIPSSLSARQLTLRVMDGLPAAVPRKVSEIWSTIWMRRVGRSIGRERSGEGRALQKVGELVCAETKACGLCRGRSGGRRRMHRQAVDSWKRRGEERGGR